jgi:shikimate dehydrogenase
LGKKIKGTNTDWVGYLNSIKQEKINKNKNILILGFGGASQAIYYGFFFKGYKNVSVFNRSKKAINIGGINKYTKDYSLINPYLIKSDLIINTTPINPLNKTQINLIKKTTIISDIVYKPKETPFLKGFKFNKKIYGISMLVEQALPCFKQWFGFIPAVDESLIKKLYKKIND